MNRTNGENNFGQCVVCQVFHDHLKPRVNCCESCFHFFINIIHFKQVLNNCREKNCQVDGRISFNYCNYCRFVKCIAAGMGSQRQDLFEEIRVVYDFFGI
ncbi:unnamed protein product [Brachionus calyciflorus]|uniref:Nuclear receptor domain-containing protein n=1 Tax=Brachionus calyciflorus TaxID=104777 RepID=A0A813Y5D4_9BILA|nr:unnamed protein product [Brachionus calyciflorus]